LDYSKQQQRFFLNKLVHSRDDATGDSLSDNDIIDNILTRMFAGSDVAASVLTSAFVEL